MNLKSRDRIEHDVDFLYLDALEYMRESRFAEARDLLANVLIDEPLCYEYLIRFGEALYLSGDPESLERALKVLSRVPMEYFDLHEKHLMGHTYELLGQFENARDSYFYALNSSKDSVDSFDLSFIHTRITSLSERKGLSLRRPKGFKAPAVDVELSVKFEKEEFFFQLRTFSRNGFELRLVTIEDYYWASIHWSIRPRMISRVQNYFRRNPRGDESKNVIWIFHYLYGDSVSHYLERAKERNRSNKLTYLELTHHEFEKLSGYRLLWLASHQ